MAENLEYIKHLQGLKYVDERTTLRTYGQRRKGYQHHRMYVCTAVFREQSQQDMINYSIQQR